jgi:hypothetical protein
MGLKNEVRMERKNVRIRMAREGTMYLKYKIYQVRYNIKNATLNRPCCWPTGSFPAPKPPAPSLLLNHRLLPFSYPDSYPSPTQTPTHAPSTASIPPLSSASIPAPTQSPIHAVFPGYYLGSCPCSNPASQHEQ